jgi:hypothetical protein
MWWHDLLWGFWNGFTIWIVLIAHIFNVWESQPFYDSVRAGTWYDLGFAIGTTSPLLASRGSSKTRGRTKETVAA